MASRSIVHIIVRLSCFPWKDIECVPLFTMYMLLGVSVSVYPLSTNCAINRSALTPMSRNDWHYLALRGMLGVSRRVVYVTSIAMLLGRRTMTPGLYLVMLVPWALLPRKWLVYPDLEMYFWLVGVGAYCMYIYLCSAIVLFANICLIFELILLLCLQLAATCVKRLNYFGDSISWSNTAHRSGSSGHRTTSSSASQSAPNSRLYESSSSASSSLWAVTGG